MNESEKFETWTICDEIQSMSEDDFAGFMAKLIKKHASSIDESAVRDSIKGYINQQCDPIKKLEIYP